MTISASMIPELENELAKTRDTLARVPSDKLDWTPHPKSGSFGWMAGHLANLPHWGLMTLTTSELVLEETPPAPNAVSTADALETFDKNTAAFLQALAQASDETLHEEWRLSYMGRELFKMPRVGVIRGMVMNHIIHHRGQLTLYLRLNGIPLPALYGPSADEGKFE